jgi:hypothetical protein
MRRAMLVAAIAAFATACTVTGRVDPTISPPPPGDVDGSPTSTPSPTATGSPAAEGQLSTGVATLVLSGDLTQTVTLSNLESAVWAPPPASMDLAWTGGGRELRLSGTSFVSLAETSGEHVLSFSIPGPDGPLEFSSADGGCSITITPALPDNVGGVFACAAITDVQGGTTVDARGTFAASG